MNTVHRNDDLVPNDHDQARLEWFIPRVTEDFFNDDELSSALKSSQADLLANTTAGELAESDHIHLPHAFTDSGGIGVHGLLVKMTFGG